MSADVGIEIQDNECVFGAVQHEVRLVVIGIVSHQAKDALARLCVSVRGDIPRTPGTPQSLQLTYLDLFQIKGWGADEYRRRGIVQGLASLRVSRGYRR